MLEKIVFIILSVITLGSGLVVVTQRNLFRAALYLVLALAGVAGMFVLLEAGFLAMVQIFVYAGAIAILIIFAVDVSTRHCFLVYISLFTGFGTFVFFFRILVHFL